MLRALERRDVAAMFGFLRRRGVAQRTLADLTGLAASEVYEVSKGRRIMAYDVLCRIADGLGVPRGRMGLAFAADDHPADERGRGRTDDVRHSTDDAADGAGDADATLLEHAAATTLGLATGAPPPRRRLEAASPTPPPRRVGVPDLVRIEAVTATLRSLDYRFGGGACRDAVVAQAAAAESCLAAEMTGPVRRRLHVAVADLHNLAGWTAFDLGLAHDARRHFAAALDHARAADEPSLTANVLYRIGRLVLQGGRPKLALRCFQLAQVAAHDGAGHTTAAMLSANEAWTYGALGRVDPAQRCLARARDELALGDDDPRRDSVAARGEQMSRSRALESAGLAVAHLRGGDTTEGLGHARHAVELASGLRSPRVWVRLTPLADAAGQVGGAEGAEVCHAVRAGLAGD